MLWSEWLLPNLCENPAPQKWWYLKVGHLGGHEAGALNQINALMRPRTLPSPFLHVRTQEVWDSEDGPHLIMLVLWSQTSSPQNHEERLMLKSYPVCGIFYSSPNGLSTLFLSIFIHWRVLKNRTSFLKFTYIITYFKDQLMINYFLVYLGAYCFCWKIYIYKWKAMGKWYTEMCLKTKISKTNLFLKARHTFYHI